MKRYAKFANTLPPEHRNTPWAEFAPPVWSPRSEGVVVAIVCILTALGLATILLVS